MKKETSNEIKIFDATSIDTYELSYLLAPTISNEMVLSEVANLKSILEKQDSVFLSGDEPKTKKLAYPITKIIDGAKRTFETAYFAWMKFEIDREKLAGLNKELAESEHLLRYLLTRAPKKDNLARPPKKFSFIKEKAEKIKEKIGDAASSILSDGIKAVSREKETEGKKKEEKDLDKTIDNLIIK